MKSLVTGANGFVGLNLTVRLRELGHEVICFSRESSINALPTLLEDVDIVFHLAGVNRPRRVAEFEEGNVRLTEALVKALSGRPIPVVYSSSVQAEANNPYGVSKRHAEEILLDFSRKSDIPVYIYRLPNVFGKWSRPNYNSVVATFCYNVVNGLPLQVNDSEAIVQLVYIDDVIDGFLGASLRNTCGYHYVTPVYSITVGELARQIQAFPEGRKTLVTERVGEGLLRALHATYLSFLPPEQFSYGVPRHGDARGTFVEMLKTQDSGQISYFTAHPGVTRGGHYHHSKTEKFLVIKGTASFRFRHLVRNERYERTVTGADPTIVETVPGWVHDITNVGSEELVVLLWANEAFDRRRPDTVAASV